MVWWILIALGAWVVAGCVVALVIGRIFRGGHLPVIRTDLDVDLDTGLLPAYVEAPPELDERLRA